MSIVVTGGAGFIGSCVVRTLNDNGITDIIVVDNIASTNKWMNLRNKIFSEYVHRDAFLERLPEYKGISHLLHFGACSATTERNFDYLYNNNVNYSKALWNYCTENEISFIYASSAATYGDGSLGFDDETDIAWLRPLNGYGYSKQLFDLWTQKQQPTPPQHVGLKLFNVYGPNEYFKGDMASMVFRGFCQLKTSRSIQLFKSYNPDYPDGGQLRDFIYIKDVCKVILFFIEHSEISGLFNVGTGHAQSFTEIIESLFTTLGLKKSIQYIDVPTQIIDTYQYFTQAKLAKLRSVGYTESFLDVATGVHDYVARYLSKNRDIY